MAQALEPRKYEALCSNSSTSKKDKGKKRINKTINWFFEKINKGGDGRVVKSNLDGV
jgi:hypothetical protein